MNSFEYPPTPREATEQLLRPAPVRETPDWKRFNVALTHHGDQIAEGTAFALERQSRLDEGTARRIAHVLGRSLGQDSSLARFAETGDGNYERLRDEYLALHNDPQVTESTHQLIDWLGTYLIRRDHPEAQLINDEEKRPPRLDNILVPTSLIVDGKPALVHIPGIYDAPVITELAELLAELRLQEDAGLQAFLSLPDTNAMSGDIMQDFHDLFVGTWDTTEDALRELCAVDDREEEVQDYAAERRLYFDYLTPDFEALREDAEEGFSLVEKGGKTHVFYR